MTESMPQSREPLSPVLMAHHHPELHRNIALVVDDTDSMRKLSRRVLSIALPGLDIHEAVDTAQALDLLSQPGFAENMAFILTDKQMPGMDGTELARVVRGQQVRGISLPEEQVRALRPVPIFMFTGDVTPDSNRDHDQLVHDEVLDHVGAKPASVEQIFHHIRSAIQRANHLKARNAA